MDVPRAKASEVLEFWFTETRPRQWFAKDPAFDQLLHQRFVGLTRRAIGGELDAWGSEATGGTGTNAAQDPAGWRASAFSY